MSLQPLNEDAGTVTAVFDLAMGISKAVAKNKNKKIYSYSSLAKAASSLIAVFPVLVSRTIEAKVAQNISKFIEQKACSLFTLALQQANISTAQSGVEYLKNFHQNLDIGGAGVDTVVRTMQAWIGGITDGAALDECGYMYEAAYNRIGKDLYYDDLLYPDYHLKINQVNINQIMESVQNISNNKYIDTNSYNTASLEDLNVIHEIRAKYRKKPVEDIPDEYWNRHYRTKKNKINAPIDIQRKARENYAKDMEDDRAFRKENFERGRRIKREDKLDKEHDSDRRYELDKRARLDKEHKEDRTYELEKRSRMDKDYQKDREYELQVRDAEQLARISSGRNVEFLKDQDIKKMNDAIPSLLVVRFYQSTTATVATEFIIGVKSRMIPVTTAEVLRRIMNDNKDGKSFLNLMRTITGELKVSDFLFNLGRIKEDIRSCRVKGAYGDTWNLLKNRADAAKEQVKYGRRNDYAAITTVLISKADADELFRAENFDITDVRNALHFMESYNLMAFGIVDEATESFRILFDDDSRTFEEISFMMLERESNREYKKLIQLMASSR